MKQASEKDRLSCSLQRMWERPFRFSLHTFIERHYGRELRLQTGIAVLLYYDNPALLEQGLLGGNLAAVDTRSNHFARALGRSSHRVGFSH